MQNLIAMNLVNQIKGYVHSNYNINVRLLREYLAWLVKNNVIEKYTVADCVVGRGGIIKRKLNSINQQTPGDLLDGDLIVGVVDDEYVILQQHDSSINAPILSCKIVIQPRQNINMICIDINV